MIDRDSFMFRYLVFKGYDSPRYAWIDSVVFVIDNRGAGRYIRLDEEYILFVYESL